MSASRRPLVTVGFVGLAIIGVGTLLPFISPYPPDVTFTPVSQTVFAIVELLWLASALVILARQPDSQMWRLLLAGLATSYIWTLSWVPNPFTVAASEFLGALAPAVFVHVVLAFPSGRLRYRIDHALVTFVYSFVAARAITLALTRDWDYPCAPNNCTGNPFLVWENNEFAGLVEVATSLAVPVIGGIVLIALWRHWRSASQTARRALGPVVFAALITYVIDSVTYIAGTHSVSRRSASASAPRSWRRRD